MPDLQSELNKIKPRKAPNRETVEPVYVKKLVDILGSTETARRIGYTQSGIQTAIRQRNEIGKTAEIAAELVYREMQRESAEALEPKEDVIAIMRIKPDKAQALQTVLSAMGVEITEI